MNKRTSSLVALLGLGAVLALGACKQKGAPKVETAISAPAPTHRYGVGDKAHCPVTNEDFVVSASTVQVEQNGHYYAFCCDDCKPTFDKHPEKYVQ